MRMIKRQLQYKTKTTTHTLIQKIITLITYGALTIRLYLIVKVLIQVVHKVIEKMRKMKRKMKQFSKTRF
jgi:hypothetical protein